MKCHRLVLVCVAFAALVLGCASPSGPTTVEHPAAPAPPQNVSVVEFDMEGAWVKYPEDFESFGLVVAEEIAGQLRDLGHNAEAVPIGGAHTGHVVVTGRVLKIDAGSRAARYWVGYGAGAAVFGVEGTVTMADGGEAGTFLHERRSGWGAFGGNSVSLVQKCVRAVGRDVAHTVHERSYFKTETGSEPPPEDAEPL
ncbi:MAG: DUF4410 domain-containing protein [Myxococcota bacterium]